MPFMDGKRVTLEEWRAAHPTPRLYGYDRGGTRFVRYPGDAPEAEPLSDRVRRVVDGTAARAGVLGAIANALGVEPDDPALAKLALPTPGEIQEPYSAVVDRREIAATRFSLAKGLPKHRKARHSQTSEGRHTRYVRQKAEAWGVSYSLADSQIRHSRLFAGCAATVGQPESEGPVAVPAAGN